jgi:hypothetical protein
MLMTIGLSLIIIGWIEQVYRSLVRRHLSFSPFFLAMYVVGAGGLAYNSLTQFDAVNASLSIVTAVLAFVLLIVLIYRYRRPPGVF